MDSGGISCKQYRTPRKLYYMRPERIIFKIQVLCLLSQLLDPMPGERILDLCAAPGGKSTGIAARMQGQGLLVSNEIIPGRAKILSQNVERMGITNALVCNESPERIASHFPLFFDRIVVDAPCSGEGMFRKDADAFLNGHQKMSHFAENVRK